MSVLVAGGAGYIGSVVVAELLAGGRRVIVLDNLSKGHREAVAPGAEFIEGDLADRALIERICREREVDTVMHFAAFIEVGESVAEPARYFENNYVHAKTLFDAAIAAGVRRAVFSSTAAVYGEPREVPIPEDHPKAPANPYGWSKLFVEETLRAYGAAYGLRSIIFRYFNAAGATETLGEDHHPETHLIPLILQTAAGARPHIKIFGADWPTPDGTCVRDYIHVSDLARAHALAVDALAGGHPGGAFNLGNGEGYSVREVIETARAITGRPIEAVEAPRRPGDPARLVASSERARRELGWAPRIPELPRIVESAWRWMRAHPRGYESAGGKS